MARAAAVDRTPSRYRWVIIANLWVHQQVALVAVAALGILLPDMRPDLGLSTAFEGWLGASRYVGPALVTLPASVYLVRATGAGVYSGILGIAGLAAIGSALAPTPEVLLVVFALHATAAMLIQVPQARIRLRWVGPREFGFVMGLTLGMAAGGQSAGIIVIPYLLPVVGGWRGVLAVIGVFALIMALIWPLLVRTGRGREVREPQSPAEGTFAFRRVLVSALRHHTFSLVGLGLLANAGTWTGILLFLPTYLTDVTGLSLQAAGLVVGVMPLGGTVGTVVGGWVSDRLGRRKPTVWAVAILQPLFYFLLLIPLPPSVLVVLALLSGIVAWVPAAALITVSHEVPGATEEDIVVGQGIVRTILTAGNLGTPLMVATVATMATSLHVGLAVLALVPLAVTMTGWFLPETGPKGQGAVGANVTAAPSEPQW